MKSIVSVLPGASVELRPERAGSVIAIKTDSSGVYRFESLPEGIYQVRFGYTGFRFARVNSVYISRGEHKILPGVGFQVTLMCTPGEPCGSTKTDSKGEFIFKNQPPGTYSIWISGLGFYSWSGTDYKIYQGFESNYLFGMERGPGGNCKIPQQVKLGYCE